VDGDGLNDVVIIGGRTVMIHAQAPDGSFGRLPDLETGDSASLILADLNGDGRNDLAVATNSGTTEVFLFESPEGRFPGTAQSVLQSAGSLSSFIGQFMALGDLNGDGRNDLLVATAGNAASVFFSQGNGLPFHESPDSILETGDAESVQEVEIPAIADLNGDGRSDAVVTNGQNGRVCLFFQEAAGSLPRLPDRVLSAEKGFHVIPTTADLNGDGREDLVLAGWNSKLRVFLQGAAGILPEEPDLDLNLAVAPWWMGRGDVNGDGETDLIFTHPVADKVSVLLANPPGSVARGTPAELRVDGTPFAVGIGDLDGDGRNDLAAANSSKGTIDLFFQTSSGSLPTAPDGALETGDRPRSLAIGDLDGDGQSDLAAANFSSGTVSIYFQRGAGSLGPAPSRELPAGVFPRSLALGDVNGDGLADLLVASRGSDEVIVFVGDIAGSLAPAPGVRLPAGSGPVAVAMGDLDGDGANDAVVACLGTSAARVYLRSPGAFREPPLELPLVSGEGPRAVVLGDLDGDGALEVALAQDGGVVSVFRTDGAGGFAKDHQKLVTGGTPLALALGGRWGDQRGQLFVADHALGEVRVYRPFSGGRLSLTRKLDGYLGPGSLALGDLSGDGRPDLAVADRETEDGRSWILRVHLAR
jgi:6-phosphogluconolactonase (cycloisomerase 2 family)